MSKVSEDISQIGHTINEEHMFLIDSILHGAVFKSLGERFKILSTMEKLGDEEEDELFSFPGLT